MRPGLRYLALVFVFLALGGCSKALDSPERVALSAGRALAAADWEAYHALTINQADLAQSALKSVGAPNTGEILGAHGRPAELDRIRREFDAVVESRRLAGADRLRVAVDLHSVGSARWDMHFLDGEGTALGVVIQVMEHGGSYRVTWVRTVS